MTAPPCAPPRPPFGFRLGVTGHRSEMLGMNEPAIAARIEQAVGRIGAAVRDMPAPPGERIANADPSLAMISALADGADQIAARAALETGYRLCAVLPFPRGATRQSLPDDARIEFDFLAGSADWLIELAGDPSEPLEAYINVGRATLDHSDLLLAVWDGMPPRGRGGTGEVVQMAVGEGMPVLHIPLSDAEPAAILWSRDGLGDTDRRPLDEYSLGELIERLLA